MSASGTPSTSALSGRGTSVLKLGSVEPCGRMDVVRSPCIRDWTSLRLCVGTRIVPASYAVGLEIWTNVRKVANVTTSLTMSADDCRRAQGTQRSYPAARNLHRLWTAWSPAEPASSDRTWSTRWWREATG